MTLTELAPGIDLERNVLAQMEFTPVVAEPLAPMPGHLFYNVRKTAIRTGSRPPLRSLRLKSAGGAGEFKSFDVVASVRAASAGRRWLSVVSSRLPLVVRSAAGWQVPSSRCGRAGMAHVSWC